MPYKGVQVCKAKQVAETRKTMKSPQYKWRLAIGTTSRVPQSKLHYLIADFDCKNLRLGLLSGYEPDHIFIQRTPNGWHVYTDLQFTFKKLCEALHILGADRSWISIGETRGYFFLADKGPVTLPWPVERMKLSGKKEINAA
jgi:hypothetical protein